MQSANISEEDESNPDRMQRILLEMKSENDPIKVNLGDGEIQYVYYGNSPTLNRLKYYPLAFSYNIIINVSSESGFLGLFMSVPQFAKPCQSQARTEYEIY